MTNRDALIQGLSARDWETDRCVAGYITCPYTQKCENPYVYGTPHFRVYCDEICKIAWLDKEFEND